MTVDTEFHRRLELLAELMIASPNKRMKSLQWEALKYYPLYHRECIRSWMTMRIAFLAADIANKPLLTELNEHA